MLAGLLCGLVLLCGVLAQNEGWHQWFHQHDDLGGSASCAVCLFASGFVDQPYGEVVESVVQVGVLYECAAPITPDPSKGDLQDFQSRGPPTVGT